MFKLENMDPARHYVWVSTNDASGGIDHYHALGYELEERGRAGGPKQVGSRPNPFTQAKGLGETYIMHYGCALMSCPMELFKERERNGGDGGVGQAGWDRVEQQLRGRGTAADHRRMLRGIPGLIGTDGRPIVRVENYQDPDDELEEGQAE